MNELMAYVNMIKEILDNDYGKEVVFYDSGEWYSREHCRNISLEELREYLIKVVSPIWTEEEEYEDDNYDELQKSHTLKINNKENKQ